jgi:membrane protease YdiL (CAAX protease family)
MAGLGVVLLVSLLISVAVNLARPTSPWATLLLGLLPIWIGLLGTALWASRTRGTGRLSVDLGFRFRWVDLAIGLGVGLGLRVVAYLFAVVAASLTGDRPAGNVPQPGTAGLAYAIVLALCLTVGAPLIEELFFRGLAVRATLTGGRSPPSSPGCSSPACT